MMYVLSSDKLEAHISSKGAEVCSLRDRSGQEYLWQADPKVWGRHTPVLFPIVGRLKENFYLYQDKKFELPQHGFARDKEFECVASGQEKCVFRLKSDAESRAVFPFDFTFEITYQLRSDQLNVYYSVRNNANEEMFFSLGAHPGFSLPLQQGWPYEDHFLEFEQDEITVTLLQDGLLSKEKRTIQLNEKKIFLSEHLFDKDALILEEGQVNQIKLGCVHHERAVILNCKNWPYFGIWSKKGCKEFICLEPWYGITDNVNSDQLLKNKKGIHLLEGKSVFTCEYSIRMQ